MTKCANKKRSILGHEEKKREQRKFTEEKDQKLLSSSRESRERCFLHRLTIFFSMLIFLSCAFDLGHITIIIIVITISAPPIKVFVSESSFFYILLLFVWDSIFHSYSFISFYRRRRRPFIRWDRSTIEIRLRKTI